MAEIIPGNEIKLGAHYKAGAEGDVADTFIRIKSPDALLDEDQTMWGDLSVSQFKTSVRLNMPEPQRTSSLETIDEWLLIARERFIASHVPSEDQQAQSVKVARHALQVAITNGFERLKTRALVLLE